MNLGHKIIKGFAVDLWFETFLLDVLESQPVIFVFPAQPSHFLLANRAMTVVEENEFRSVIHEAVLG